MKFYYTTTAGEGESQNKSISSLGGYRSGTKVPNNKLGNLFDEITPYSIKRDEDQYIALYLLNDTGSDATDVTLYFSYPEDAYSKLEIGSVVPGTDADGVDYIEHVDTIYDQPYSATFYEAEGVDNAVNIGDITNGSALGIYIKRSILVDDIKKDYNNRITKSGDIYVESELNKSDSIDMVLSWT